MTPLEYPNKNKLTKEVAKYNRKYISVIKIFRDIKTYVWIIRVISVVSSKNLHKIRRETLIIQIKSV